MVFSESMWLNTEEYLSSWLWAPGLLNPGCVCLTGLRKLAYILSAGSFSSILSAHTGGSSKGQSFPIELSNKELNLDGLSMYFTANLQPLPNKIMAWQQHEWNWSRTVSKLETAMFRKNLPILTVFTVLLHHSLFYTPVCVWDYSRPSTLRSGMFG